MTDPVDLLLLNASNYPRQPVFPYAFVQVSALARTHGLTVARYDFLGRPRTEWPALLADLVAAHRPRMVGFHLRQADSLYLDEYRPVASVQPPADPYFPVDDTRLLIEQVRRLSDAPVVVGGFGFATHAVKLFDFFRPDYGVAGAPDAFFSSFDSLARRDLGAARAVENLICRDAAGLHRGPDAYFPPLAHGEYDEAVFADLCAFYASGASTLSIGRLGAVDAPVEIMRGCPCRCYFCTEPYVKGRKIQRRNLDAVMSDVEFLAARDIRSIYFICSEINMGGMEFPLELAACMERFNARRGSRHVLWKAYAMPRPGMSRDQLRYMMSAGYVPSWNEFVSFDDANLEACRMPYRTAHAVAYLNDVLELSSDPEVYHGPPLRKFDLFLGNAFMTDRAMRNTLAVIDREGYAERHRQGTAISATRVFEPAGALICGDTSTVFSIGPAGELPAPDVLRPTFHYAPELLARLGTFERVEEFLAFVSSTFLTCKYAENLDVLGFLASTCSATRFAEYLATRAEVGRLFSAGIRAARAKAAVGSQQGAMHDEAADLSEALWTDPTEVRVRALHAPWTAPRAARAACAQMTMSLLLVFNSARLRPIYEHLGLADADARATPYRIMRELYARFDTNAQVVASVRETFSLDDESLPMLLTKYLLFANNVYIDPAYRPLLFEPAAPAV